MPNCRVIGIQGCGKTSGMLWLAVRIIQLCPEIFSWQDVYSNFKIEFPGTHTLTNKEMREYLKKVYAPPPMGELGDHTLKIIMVDEIDGLYPQWTHNDKDMRNELQGTYQDEKLQNWLICTTHKPSNFNKILRDACEVTLMPKIHHGTDTLDMIAIDERFENLADIKFPQFSLCYGVYNREGVVL